MCDIGAFIRKQRPEEMVTVECFMFYAQFDGEQTVVEKCDRTEYELRIVK